MEFMKVFDQTVRELKREVNKSILKVPEIEQKVLDATSNEAWGPHGTLMSEIAQATRNYTEFQMIMGVLWKRLADTGKNWRHVYKALTVLEFLVAHGSERVIDEIRQYSYQITTLADFQYLEANGKDQGINVRKKSQSLLALVNDKDKIREVREKAAANRDKYRGISSSGGISSAGSYRSAGGGFGGGGYGEYNTSRYARDNDHYHDEDRYDSDWDRPSRDQDGYRNRRNGNDFNQHTEPDNEHQKEDENSAKYSSVDRDHDVGSAPAAAGQASSTMHKKPDIMESDDFDDFDPRASTGTAATARSNVPAQVEPVGGVSSWSSSTDLLGDLSSPAPASSGSSLQQPGGNAFEDSLLKTEPSFFPSFPSAAANNAPSSISTPALDKFATTTSSDGTGSFDPFADFSMNQNATTSYGGTDLFQDQSFGAFVGAQGGTEATFQIDVPANTSFQTKQAATPQPVQQLSPLEPQKPKGSLNSVPKPQQDKFELKSTVWTDSLSKGLIDLNLAAPKSTSLADIGIEYGLFQNENLKEERSVAKTSTIGKGKAMGSGSGLGLAGASALAPPPGPAMMSNMTMGSNIGTGFSPAMSSNVGMPTLYANPGMGMRPGITDFSSVGMGIGMGTGMGGYSTQQKS